MRCLHDELVLRAARLVEPASSCKRNESIHQACLLSLVELASTVTLISGP